MYISLDDLLPSYFETDRKQQSEIWGKQLRFDRGELVKIIAPSGSGKTSLIHFLYGLRKEFTGKICYDETSVKELSAKELAGFRSNKLSIVLQDLRLFPDQTVEQNLEIKRQLNPYHPPEKLMEMAERLGILSKMKSRCGTCSYGEQQRVAIIRSLLQPFDFLLLDEPFSHLDNKNSEKAMELMLEEAKAREAAIIFADLERVDYFPFTRLYHL